MDPHLELEKIGVAYLAYCRALDSLIESLANDETIRNHPERHLWETKLSELTPSFPRFTTSLNGILKEINKASK